MSKVSTHASYWMEDDMWNEDNDLDTNLPDEQANLARITRLSAARRAVANFVNILTGRNDIPVQFSSGQNSYTDGQVVVIAADDNPEHFDSMVGLALHEGSHILLTDFDFMKEIAELDKSNSGFYGFDQTWNGTHHSDHPNGRSIFHQIMHPALSAMLPKIGVKYGDYAHDVNYDADKYRPIARRFYQDIKLLMNVMEDRRIDRWVYRNAGGYRPYYDALYERYFFTSEVRKNLKWNPEWRTLTVENYINHLLFSIHPDFNPDALPGLRELVKMMDIQNIDRIDMKQDSKWRTEEPIFENMPTFWKEANLIYAYILRFAALGEMEKQEKNPQNIPQEVLDTFANTIQNTSDLPNLDHGPMVEQEVDAPDKTKNGKDKPTSFNAKRGQTAIDKARQIVNGELRKKKATKAEKNAVDALESAAADMVSLKGDGIPGGECMVTRKMSEKLFSQDWFIFSRRWDGGYISDYRRSVFAAGKRMGQILVHRLQVRNDPVVTKNTRLPQGGLDRRLLAQLGMDITSVFQKTRVDTYKPAMLHLTLDASGSMSGRKWDKVMTVATALAYVGAKMRNIDTVISIRGGSDIPMVCIVYDSRKDRFENWMKWAPRLEPSGMTPEGLCFKATMELITECAATHDVYFINFSDGEPGFSLDTRATDARGRRQGRKTYYGDGVCQYSGDVATKHTRKMIMDMTEMGVKVLSYFISDSSYEYGVQHSLKTFRKMYGEDAVNVNVSNATEVLRTLNKRLTART